MLYLVFNDRITWTWRNMKELQSFPETRDDLLHEKKETGMDLKTNDTWNTLTWKEIWTSPNMRT